jgi:hypothetical protein
MSFSFGSDPELVLEKSGRPFSAIGIVPGDSFERHKIGRHEFYYDNVLAECAVAPGKTKEEFIENLRDCITKYTQLVSPYKLVIKAAVNYPRDQLNHPDAIRIGCSPEWCVYTLTDIKPDGDAFAKSRLRTAGGHIHLGSKIAKDEYGCFSVVRMLDLFLGIPSIYIDHDPTAKMRKKWYGRAGRFRQPKHGVEYRSLSNFWIASPKLVSLIYDICEFVLKYVEDGRHEEFWTIDKKTLEGDEAWNQKDFDPASCHQCHGYNLNKMRKAIDTMNKTLGKTFMDLIKGQMPARLFNNIKKATTPHQYELKKEWNLKLN